MKKSALLLSMLLFAYSQISAQVTEGYITNNLGRIVEVANSGGTLTTPHALIGYDSTGFVYHANSLNQFKVFGNYPNSTSLQNLNNQNRFGAPGANDCYEIRFGSDSSRYWINASNIGLGGVLAPNQLPFSVYHVGPRSSVDTATNGGTKLCLKIIDEDSDGLYTPGERLYIFADLALPLDSTYDSLSYRDTNPFNSARSVITYLRFGKSSVPYSQTTFDVSTDGFVPSHGTVIRFVARTADTIAPIISFTDSIVEATNVGAQYRFPIPTYSFEPVVYSLENAPEGMTLSHDTLLWTISSAQYGNQYSFRIKAENSAGYSYKCLRGVAGHQSTGAHVHLWDNDIDYWTSNNGIITNNQLMTNYGMGWTNSTIPLIYASGMYLAGKKPGNSGDPDTISVTNVEFSTEYQPGRILNSGPLGDLIAENPNSPTAHVFVLPDHASNWPSEAPHDALGNPMKLSARDTWTVFNDIDLSKHFSDGLSLDWHAPGFGIEVQRQTFQFLDFPFNNSVLVRLIVINKTTRHYHDFHFGLWADPDVGSNYTEDLCALDTLLPCLVTYSSPSGGDQDNSASGILMLQNPIETGTPIDTAEKNIIGQNGFIKHKIPGKKNVSASGAISYPNPLGEPSRLWGDWTRYWYTAGLDGNGNPKPNGRYDLTVTGTTANDQRGIIGVGPFTFFAGDTQEVWYALIGGRGTNKANAVDTVLDYARLIKSRFFADMNSVVIGVDELYNNLPQSVNLQQNYPNPFNPSTNIRYEINKSSKVSLKIYNLLGQEVRTLVNKQQSNGIHTVQWDGKNNQGQRVSSGVYLYRLEAGDFVKTRKMVLVK